MNQERRQFFERTKITTSLWPCYNIIMLQVSYRTFDCLPCRSLPDLLVHERSEPTDHNTLCQNAAKTTIAWQGRRGRGTGAAADDNNIFSEYTLRSIQKRKIQKRKKRVRMTQSASTRSTRLRSRNNHIPFRRFQSITAIDGAFFLIVFFMSFHIGVVTGFFLPSFQILNSPSLVGRRTITKLYSQSKNGTTQETPHAGRHFLPSHPYYHRPWWRRIFWKRRRRRFMEGWYYRLTLVEQRVSFAFITSMEDPGIPSSDLTLACIQVVGPKDTYLVQASKDDTKFWASRRTQSLGYVFSYFNEDDAKESLALQTELRLDVWKENVKAGFQVSPRHFVGRVKGHDGTRGGVLDGQGIEGSCEFEFTVDPICGWGSCSGGDSTQKSTGGWLSSFPIFEPHWQVTMADARASGYVDWNGTRYEFKEEPFYAEKNWGAALPSKWFWTQCNSFQGYNQLSVTAGGGIRKLPFGYTEALGMVSVHHNGTFYEAVPWKGIMAWNVSTWGSWQLSGECYDNDRPFAVEVTYECGPEEIPGLVFRAPTPDEGMVYFCRDTFDAYCTLSLWELVLKEGSSEKVDGSSKYCRKEPPIIDRATSCQGGAEIGGGPWWTDWKAQSNLKRVIKVLLNIPNKFSSLRGQA